MPLSAEQQEIVLQWRPLAIKIARGFTKARRRKDEYESEALLALCQAVESYDASHARDDGLLKAWISMVVRQAMIRYRDRHLVKWEFLSPDFSNLLAAKKTLIIEHLEQLEGESGDVARAHWLQGLSKKTIAGDLGVSIKTVNRLLRQAKRQLTQLGDYDEAS